MNTDHIPTLDERVDKLMSLVMQLISQFKNTCEGSVEMAGPEDKVDGFLSPKEEREQEEAGNSRNGKACLPKFVPPQLFDGMMKETISFICLLILYIHGRKVEFPNNEAKIMFALSYMQGGKAQYWKNEGINLIAAGNELFKDFKDFLMQLEIQFGDPSPKATAIGKLKMLHQGLNSVGEYILQFKVEASQMDLGDSALIEYLKVGLNPLLFKSIY